MNNFLNYLEQKEVGTYAAVRFEDSEEKVKYLKQIEIPNVNEDLHCTLIYSRKHCSNYEPMNMTDGEFYEEAIAYPDHLEIFKDKQSKNCLVLVLRSGWITKRHKDIIKEHGATHDYNEFIPHVTLSYDVADFDFKSVEEQLIKSDEFYKLVINKEYKEDLNEL